MELSLVNAEATKEEDETLVETEEKQRIFRVNGRCFYHGWRTPWEYFIRKSINLPESFLLIPNHLIVLHLKYTIIWGPGPDRNHCCAWSHIIPVSFLFFLFCLSIPLAQLLSYTYKSILSLLVRTPALLLTAPPHTPVTLPSPAPPQTDGLLRQKRERATDSDPSSRRPSQKKKSVCSIRIISYLPFRPLIFNIFQTTDRFQQKISRRLLRRQPDKHHLQVRGSYTFRYGYSFALSSMSMTVASPMEWHGST